MDLVHPDLLRAVIGSIVFVVVGAVLMTIMLCKPIRLLDRLTPGDLPQEICPPGHLGREPNTALAIIVGCLLLGFSHIVAMSIH